MMMVVFRSVVCYTNRVSQERQKLQYQPMQLGEGLQTCHTVTY